MEEVFKIFRPAYLRDLNYEALHHMIVKFYMIFVCIIAIILTEITTHARHPTSFYKVSSNALSFEVKAHNAAVVGLAKEPGSSCLYWFGFGQGGKLWIKGPNWLKTSHGGNYSLTLNQFRRFWIAWDCGTLRVGQGREITHILAQTCSTGNLKYITFGTDDPRHPATWKFELPPASLINIGNNDSHKKIQGGELRWVAAEDALPDDAVIGGFQGECLYIIRGNHAGSLTPGKFVPSEGVAYVSWGGSANITPDFEILCGYNYVWKATSDDKIPVDAFVAGYSEVNHEKLYIGRVTHMNLVIPGKVQPSHKVCYAAVVDNELPFKDYEILTIPDLNPYTATPFMETNLDLSVIRHMVHNENAFVMINENNDDDDDEISEDEEDNLQREWDG